jgi:hypothetical protein
VKPHPAEDDRDIASFIKRFAPRAIPADLYAPIDTILDITDVLFNRGNSQVVLNALDRGIPVAVVPLGRPTFFQGLADDAIVDGPDQVGKAMAAIRSRGMGLYRPVFERYLSIGPDEAMDAVVSRIKNIADNKDIRQPHERLMQIALFWAWMGYATQSLRLIARIERSSGGAAVRCAEEARRLVLYRADGRDLGALKKWLAGTYMEWILQSLWIKELYYARSKMSDADRQWLAGFPPRMNRHHFLPFVLMLGWCHMRSGSESEARALAEKTYEEYRLVSGVPAWKEMMGQSRGIGDDIGYWQLRTQYSIKTALKSIALTLGVH